MKSTMMSMPLNLNDIVERAGTQFSQVEVVSRLPDRSLARSSYGEVYRRSEALAQALLNAGLQAGDRVATLCWNHSQHLEAYFGIPRAGGVLHTLNLRLPPNDIAWIVNHAQDRFLIIDDVLLPLYQAFASSVNFERIFVVRLTDSELPEGMDDYERFLDEQHEDLEFPVLAEDAPCGLCYTSGTTGRPKGVVYSHRSSCLHAMVSALPDSIGLSCNDVALPVVPMFHANAWGMPYSAALTGAKLVLPGPHLDGESILGLFASEQVTVTAGVPTIWMRIAELLEERGGDWDMPSIRMLVGGSAVPEAMIKSFQKFGHTIIQGWGMTETSPLAAISQLRPWHRLAGEDEQLRQRAKAGALAPFVQARIVSEDGNAQPWDGNATGEIQLRGPWITGDYVTADDASDKFTEDGYLCTGDVASIDKDGFISISDRTKDLIKAGGEWISSVQLENEIMGHEAVLEAAVISKAHDRWGERPLAIVVTRSDESVDVEQLSEFLSRRIEKWMLPEAYVFVEEIRKTSTGKFDKKALRAEYEHTEWAVFDACTA